MFFTEPLFDTDENNMAFLSNIPAADKELILEAAKQAGYKIVVRDKATTKNGSPLDGFVGVYTYDVGKEHKAFWDKYYQLKVEAGLVDF